MPLGFGEFERRFVDVEGGFRPTLAFTGIGYKIQSSVLKK
jgi:hypothetical protein